MRSYHSLLALFLTFPFLIWSLSGCSSTFVYEDHRKETVITIDDTIPLTLQDISFYIWYEEYVGDLQAKMYNPDNPRAYWNLYVNGSFMSTFIKESTLELIIHDTLLYHCSVQQHITLTGEEEKSAYNMAAEYYACLSEKQIDVLGVSFEDFCTAVDKMALAKKYVLWMCEVNGTETDVWAPEGIAYEALLEEHSYTVNDALWEQLPIGEITLFYKE